MKQRILNPGHPMYRRRGNITEMLLILERDSPDAAAWFLGQIPKDMTIAEFMLPVIIDLYDEETDKMKEKLLAKHRHS
jgi:hypothetical protein